MVEVPPEPDAGEPAVAEVVLLFARVDDVIDDDELTALRAIDGVTRVRASRRDDVALVASARADGTTVDSLPDGFKISLSAQVADDSDGIGSIDLAPGEVAMTREGLAFRDLDVGGTVRLIDDVTRRVAAIVHDEALDGIEIVLRPDDADTLGIRERQRALLSLAPDADVDAVTAAVVAVLGEGVVTQERSAADDRPIVLSLPETKAAFGEFAFRDLDGRDVQAGASWIEANIVDTHIPIIGRVVCHRAIIDDLTAVMDDIIAAGLASELNPGLYGGCWAPRRINKNANLSRHAWGIAIDVNVDFEAPGLGPIPSDGVIDAFERHGFRWGGDYPVPDNHHFEWVGP